MPLAVVAELVAAGPERQAELLEDYRVRLEERSSAQRELLVHLQARLSGQESRFDRFPIEQRHVPDQRVLTALRHTTVIGLSPWLGDTLSRLSAEADALGGRAGSAFVIFHGEVNEDSDGPVEVCVPVRSTTALLVPHRVEPAHHEVLTAITVAQVAFPQILSAYEAVERWISDRGGQVSGSPREVYVDGFDRLGAQEVGCEIAFPVAAPISA
jgi:hypothetical protein